MSQNPEIIAQLNAAIEVLTKARNDMQKRHDEAVATLASHKRKVAAPKEGVRTFFQALARK